MSDAAKVQAMPVSNQDSRDVLTDLINTAGWDGQPLIDSALKEQLEQRVALGVRKYGTRLETNNGRDVLLDIRQELLDGIMYSHQGVMQGERVAHIRGTCISLIKSLNALERAK